MAHRRALMRLAQASAGMHAVPALCSAATLPIMATRCASCPTRATPTPQQTTRARHVCGVTAHLHLGRRRAWLCSCSSNGRRPRACATHVCKHTRHHVTRLKRRIHTHHQARCTACPTAWCCTNTTSARFAAKSRPFWTTTTYVAHNTHHHTLHPIHARSLMHASRSTR